MTSRSPQLIPLQSVEVYKIQQRSTGAGIWFGTRGFGLGSTPAARRRGFVRGSKEVRDLIFQMVAENPTWGAPPHSRRTAHAGLRCFRENHLPLDQAGTERSPALPVPPVKDHAPSPLRFPSFDITPVPWYRTKTLSPFSIIVDSILDPTTAVLLIENNKSHLRLLATLLRHNGYVVRSADNGSEGLRLYEQCEKFFAVIIAYELPGNWFHIAAAIRRRDSSQKMVIEALDHRSDELPPRPTELADIQCQPTTGSTSNRCEQRNSTDFSNRLNLVRDQDKYPSTEAPLLSRGTHRFETEKMKSTRKKFAIYPAASQRSREVILRD